MRLNFDDLVRTAGGDGASGGMRFPDAQFDADADADAERDAQELMGAWSMERQRAVEAELILTKALRFLKRKLRANRILADPERREIQELIRVIRFRLEQQC